MFSRVTFARALWALTIFVAASSTLPRVPSAYGQEILKASCNDEAGYRADEILGELKPGENKGRVRCSVQFKAAPKPFMGPVPPGWTPAPDPKTIMTHPVEITFDPKQFSRLSRPALSLEVVPGGDARTSSSQVRAVKGKVNQFEVLLPSQSTATLFFNLYPVPEYFPATRTVKAATVKLAGKMAILNATLFKKDVGSYLLRLQSGELAAAASGKTAFKLEAQTVKTVSDRNEIALKAKATEDKLFLVIDEIAKATDYLGELLKPYNEQKARLDAINTEISSFSSDITRYKGVIDAKTKKNDSNNVEIPRLEKVKGEAQKEATRLNEEIVRKNASIIKNQRLVNFYASLGWAYMGTTLYYDKLVNDEIRARDRLVNDWNAQALIYNNADGQITALQKDTEDNKKIIAQNEKWKSEVTTKRDAKQTDAQNVESQMKAQEPGLTAARAKIDAAIAKVDPILKEVADNQVKLEASTKSLLESLKPIK